VPTEFLVGTGDSDQKAITDRRAADHLAKPPETLYARLVRGGIVGLGERLIAEIVGRIRSVTTLRQILIFGSAAAGSLTPDSDIDLLMLEDDPVDARPDRLRIRQALRGLGWAFDIVVMTMERFDETKGVVGTIAYPANRQGQVVYEAA